MGIFLNRSSFSGAGEESPDDAHAIGRTAVWHRASARRVLLDEGSGQVTLGPEEAVSFGFRRRSVTVEGREEILFRLEVKVPKGTPTGPGAGDEIVVCEHPYSNGWVDRAAFKPGCHKVDAESRVRAVSPSALKIQLQRLPEEHGARDAAGGGGVPLRFDPWETGNYLTAGIALPERSDAPHGCERNSMEAGWVFGICRAYRTLESKLAASEAVKRLVALAEAGRLRVNPSGEAPRFAHRAAVERVDLYLAIRQAFAGPWASPAHDGAEDKWAGVPLSNLVEWIYKNHLWNETRRVVDSLRIAEVEL